MTFREYIESNKDYFLSKTPDNIKKDINGIWVSLREIKKFDNYFLLLVAISLKEPMWTDVWPDYPERKIPHFDTEAIRIDILKCPSNISDINELNTLKVFLEA